MPDLQEIKRRYYWDLSTLTVFIVLAWVVIASVLIKVINLSHDPVVNYTVLAAGITGLIFTTSALAAVIMHLKHNGSTLYREEIKADLLIKEQGRIDEIEEKFKAGIC